MKQKKKALNLAILIVLVVLTLVGAALLGYHLTGRYKETIVDAVDGIFEGFRGKLTEIEDGLYAVSSKDIINNESKENNTMEKYVCDVCEWIYDPEKGDSEHGIQPGVPFESLPEDWVCPLCGVGKDMFRKED